MGKQVGQIQVSGKFGALVGSKGRNGRAYLRAKSDKPLKPATTSQQKVQTRFKAIGELATDARNALKLGLKNKAKQLKCSVYNAFTKLNWDNVRCNMPGVTTVNYPELILAVGNVPNVRFGSPNFDEPLSITVTFQGNADMIDADATDKVYMYAYCPDTGEGILTDSVSRSASTITMNVPINWNGMKVHVWGFVIGGENGLTDEPSDSVYIGTGNIG